MGSLAVPGCLEVPAELEGWGCRNDVDCVPGFRCDLGTGRCETQEALCIDLDDDGYGEGAGCLAPDCDDTQPSCALDCVSNDHDDVPDCADDCFDQDGDGLGQSSKATSLCVRDAPDRDDDDHTVCADLDHDGCDDCSSGHWDPMQDGDDADQDGLCDEGDGDDDDDTVPDSLDPDPLDPFVCGDQDKDTCDDCALSGGPPAPWEDGPDLDGNGTCNQGELCQDADGDGLGIGQDGNPGCLHPSLDLDDTDPTVCADTDHDTCDDCSSGSWDPYDDGLDIDGDGLCVGADRCEDADGDGIGVGTLGNPDCLVSVVDQDDTNPAVCADTDHDECDDCSSGSFAPWQDGPDADGDDRCDATDTCTDADGDGIGNGNLGNLGCETDVTDQDDADATVCADTDGDSCDDCSSGHFDPANDGEGSCAGIQSCVDSDGDGFGDGTAGNVGCQYALTDLDDANARVCADTDGDQCDDCSQGPFDPTNDGTDADGDGECDKGDPCTDADGDGIGRSLSSRASCLHSVPDSNDSDNLTCADTDHDSCDDCASGQWDPFEDGLDWDEDGKCDLGDPDDDNDGVDDIKDRDPFDPFVCQDTDGDGCDDCSVSGGPPAPNDDGPDSDGSGMCDLFSWYDERWRFRKPVTIAKKHVTDTLTDFPLLVALTDHDLSDHAREDGHDIVFAAADGVTRLDHEVEIWHPVPGRLVAWVRIPELRADQDTLLYLYYGFAEASDQQDPDALWVNGYRGVWHLGSLTEAVDSSAYARDGGPENMGTGALVDGIIGHALDFDGLDDLVRIPAGPGIDNVDPITVEVWIRPRSWGEGGYGRIVAKALGGNHVPLCLYLFSLQGARSVQMARGHQTGDTRVRPADGSIRLSAWQHVVATIDPAGGVARAYVNGIEYKYATQSLGTGPLMSDASYDLIFGNSADLDRAFDGLIDEVRISRTVRSQAWAETSYRNQVEPPSFYRVGPAQEIPSD